MRLMVYPPPPAKGGITVTNEDEDCLHDGEFLNEMIIDFLFKNKSETGPVFEQNPLCHGPIPVATSVPDLHSEENMPDYCRPLQQYTSELDRIRVCYSSGDDTYTFSDDQSACQDESSDDGTLAEDALSSDTWSLASKPSLCKQPCILIMDSLCGSAKPTVMTTLRADSLQQL